MILCFHALLISKITDSTLTNCTVTAANRTTKVCVDVCRSSCVGVCAFNNLM